MGRSDQSSARVDRLAAWQTRVATLVAAAAGGRVAPAEYAGLAATVVGMFDAGARDAEVTTFLRRVAADIPGLDALSDTSLSKLAAELHRAAAGRSPHVAT
jgi:hypothetical protein